VQRASRGRPAALTAAALAATAVDAADAADHTALDAALCTALDAAFHAAFFPALDSAVHAALDAARRRAAASLVQRRPCNPYTQSCEDIGGGGIGIYGGSKGYMRIQGGGAVSLASVPPASKKIKCGLKGAEYRGGGL